jgi:hypothetical protein
VSVPWTLMKADLQYPNAGAVLDFGGVYESVRDEGPLSELESRGALPKFDSLFAVCLSEVRAHRTIHSSSSRKLKVMIEK